MRNLKIGLMLGSLLVAAPLVSADTIRFNSGRKAVGKVTVVDETLEKVDYRSRALRQTQSFAADIVAEVVYTDPPEEYLLAMDNLDLLAFEDAAKYFKLAATDANKRKGLVAKCLYEAGEALRRAGNTAEAVATFDDLMTSQENSRYVPYASLQRGIALSQSGDSRRAQAAFEKLKGDSRSKGFGERWGFEADLQLLILTEKENPAAALEAYQRLVSTTKGKHDSVANQAQLRIGRVYVATGQFDEAKAFFQTILDNRAASTREIVAGAYNGLGAALRKKKGASDADIRKALYNYLRVIVSYGDVLDEQAEALFSAGKCFQRVPGEESLTRSKTLLYRCINEHPDSKWAQEAQKG